MNRRFYIFFCFLIIVLLTFTGCSFKEEPKINDKLDVEISYIEDLIFKIINKYAKKEYIEDEKINFDYIKEDVNRINDTWNTLILDLTEVNISNEDILNFSNELNNLIITIGEKDDIKMIDDMSIMYSQLIKFKAQYSENKNLIKKYEVKNNVLQVFNFVNKSEFNLASQQIDYTIASYRNLMNDNDYASEYTYNLNKIYILLEEYKNSIQTQNYDLICIKYINTIENL